MSGGVKDQEVGGKQIMARQNSLQKKLQGQSKHGRNSGYSKNIVRVVPGYFRADHKKGGVTLPSQVTDLFLQKAAPCLLSFPPRAANQHS